MFALNYRIGRILCLLLPGHEKDLELGGTWEQHHGHGTRARRFARDARRAHPLFTGAAPLPGQGPGGGAKQSQCPKAGPGSAARESGPRRWGRDSVSAEMPELRSGFRVEEDQRLSGYRERPMQRPRGGERSNAYRQHEQQEPSRAEGVLGRTSQSSRREAERQERRLADDSGARGSRTQAP